MDLGVEGSAEAAMGGFLGTVPTGLQGVVYTNLTSL